MSHAKELRIGAALEGRYTIIREIGRGGMATVFLAHDVKHDRDVALKVLHGELGAVLGADRFLAEIRTTAQLHHPNILPLFDSGEADGMVFYVMPYVEGENLRDRITREGQLGITDSVRVVQAVADALDHAHKHGVIHRDIKPENILLQDGHALVADFGIAIAVSNAGGQRITQTGFSVGTPQYMSPEQAAAERQIDGKSDQYSLAAVLYEMLTGEPPFTGPNAASVISRMMTEPAADVTRRRPSVPEAVSTALHRALEKVPGDRFATVSAFGAALAPPLRATGDHRTAASSVALRSRPWWRDARNVIAVGAVALAVIAFVLRRRSAGSADTEPRRWSITLDDSLPMSTSHDQVGTLTRSLDLSPDGRTLLYTSPAGSSSRIVAVDLVSGVSRVVPNTVGTRSPAFSPDSRSFAAVVGDSEVRRYTLADGSFVRLGSDVMQTLSWPFDDRIFGDGGCVVIPATGGPSDAERSRAACNGTWVAGDAARVAGQSRWLLLSSLDHVEAITPAGAVRALTADASGIRGDAPRYVAPGFLVYVNGNTLNAAAFDSRTGRLTGTPQAVLAGIRHEQSGTAQYAVSDDGTLVWAGGADGAMARFVWVDRTGRVLDTLRFIPPGEIGSFALSDDGQKLAYSLVGADGATTLTVADLARQTLNRIPSPLRIDPLVWIDRGLAISAVATRGDGSTIGALVTLGASHDPIDTTVPGVETQSVDGAVSCRSPIYGSTQRSPVVVWHREAPHDSMIDQNTENSVTGCVVSPDGRFVMLGTTDGLFVASSRDDGLAHRVRMHGDPLGECRWSMNGREIFCRGAMTWYAMPAPGPGLQVTGNPHPLFSGNYLQAFSDWDRSPDGRFLLLAGEPPGLQTHLNVITHFDRDLANHLGGNAK